MSYNTLNLVSKSKKIRFVSHHLLFIALFGILYYVTTIYFERDGFKKIDNSPITLWDCIHFSLVTQTTVGYGGIIPMGSVTKIVNAIQLLTIFGVIVINLI
jgi:voltage-gated potassium channel